MHFLVTFCEYYNLLQFSNHKMERVGMRVAYSLTNTVVSSQANISRSSATVCNSGYTSAPSSDKQSHSVNPLTSLCNSSCFQGTLMCIVIIVGLLVQIEFWSPLASVSTPLGATLFSIKIDSKVLSSSLQAPFRFPTTLRVTLTFAGLA